MSSGFVVFCVLLAGFCFVSWKHSLIGVRDAVMLAGRGFILLALCTLLIYVIQRVKSFFSPAYQDLPDNPLTESSRLKQEKIRINQQNEHNEKMSDYVDAVIKPRQNSLLQQKMERYHRMTGDMWKLTQGFNVGEETETHDDDDDINKTPNQRARRRRRIQTAAQVIVQQEVPKQKTVIVLPDEPLPDTDGVVKIALKCPSGRTIHRRFLKTWSSIILLDWMKKSGYHPVIYTLCTSYPRKPLEMNEDVSLEDAGIMMDTMLNVEEKDPSTT